MLDYPAHLWLQHITRLPKELVPAENHELLSRHVRAKASLAASLYRTTPPELAVRPRADWLGILKIDEQILSTLQTLPLLTHRTVRWD